MSDGYGPPQPTTTTQRNIGRYIVWAMAALVTLFVGIGVVGMILTPDMPTDQCEYVVTPKRDDAYLKCPVPQDYKIPDWPDKQAPLNK